MKLPSTGIVSSLYTELNISKCSPVVPSSFNLMYKKLDNSVHLYMHSYRFYNGMDEYIFKEYVFFIIMFRSKVCYMK